jgi:hypothetical protein
LSWKEETGERIKRFLLIFTEIMGGITNHGILPNLTYPSCRNLYKRTTGNTLIQVSRRYLHFWWSGDMMNICVIDKSLNIGQNLSKSTGYLSMDTITSLLIHFTWFHSLLCEIHTPWNSFCYKIFVNKDLFIQLLTYPLQT